MTSAERVAVLEGRMNESMSDFDGMIIREREYNQNRENQRKQAAAAELPAGGTLADIIDMGDNGKADSGQGEGSEQVKNRSNSGGGYLPEGEPSQMPTGSPGARPQSMEVPKDLPDGSDDDVVARQIREAAMREIDPVLREKLWDEYRKYKNQTQ